jgi:hypothetical protein
MGLEQEIGLEGKNCPGWPVVRDLLARHQFPVQLRMIDNELALPDELPSESWRELRLGTPQGMVTVRRAQGRVLVITWGNADAPLLQAWNALAWAYAEAGGGKIQTPAGAIAAADFRRTADLPASLRG